MPPAPLSTDDSNNSRTIRICWILLFLFTACAAVSSQSLWIDEAQAAVKATQPSWGQFVESMRVERGSDIQMPGYMAALWAWEKIAGSSERALRSLNVLWMGLGLWALLFCWHRPLPQRVLTAAMLVLSAFSWAYLDEARPYAMQIGSATLIAVALTNLLRTDGSGCAVPRFDALLAAIGAIVLSASSLIGAFFCAFFGAAFFVLWIRQDRRFKVTRTRPLLLLVAVSGLLMGALLLYYLWTLTLGAGASPVGKTGVANIMFAAYELSGLSGLGPGRLAIRESGLPAFIPFLIPLSIGGLVLSGVIALGLIRGRNSVQWRYLSLVLVVGLAITGILLVGYVSGFRLLGRHLSPVFPLVIMALGWCLWEGNSSRNAGRFIPGFLLIVTFVASALSQRFHPRFLKDDYRSASRIALETLTKNGVVWWAADPTGANYYGVFLKKPGAGAEPQPTPAFQTINESAEALHALPEPTLVIFSKTDIYDDAGFLQKWLSEHDFEIAGTFPAFTLWRSAKKGG